MAANDQNTVVQHGTKLRKIQSILRGLNSYYSVITELLEFEIPEHEYNELFEWQYTEDLQSITYGNLLSFEMGLLPIIDVDYRRQWEVGELIGGLLSTEKEEIVIPAFHIHQKSQHLIERFFIIQERMDNIALMPPILKN